MTEMYGLVRVFWRIYAGWLAACLLLWALLPDLRPIFAGLMLGASASAYNVYILASRVEKVAEAASKPGGRRAGIGFVSRIATVLIALMMALKLEAFDLVSTVSTLALGPIAILIIAAARHAMNR